ncbi:hypothetical protein DFA_06253 [Cavenderia fasciculata]|uniref:F5/8 type C domain-containing protein n=1 Tax=Cavenderia fasciculata TaxID=261658 RepID=F4PKJ0_CACFS|nr:uncharacterized protein DFA_06253 [Cavenderia fasciculata]EGG24114.1 hypothetical protein DFA_06253 [Cavenderia fasciculata]|eukprot:XP_004361965.1 hypothetical protein DFA_06253 [Cavenderia fasciculata]
MSAPAGTVALVQHALVNIRTSSNYSPNHTQYNIILNHTENPNNANDGTSGWSSSYVDQNQYIVLGGDVPKEIVAVATQGRGDFDQWITSYKIRWSLDNVSWFDYNGGQVINANNDRNSIVTFNLPTPLLCRSLSIHPVTWNGHISCRLEVYAQPLKQTYVQQGQVYTGDNGALNAGPDGAREIKVQVTFPKKFRTVPQVAITFDQLDISNAKNIRSGVQPQNITTSGFEARFYTWSDTRCYSLRADYIAVEEI